MNASNFRLFFLISPVTWAAYFTTVYLLIEAACNIGLLREFVVGLSLLLMVPTLGVVLFVGYKSRELQTVAENATSSPRREVSPEETMRFTAQVGIWLSILFVILTLGVGVSALVLQPC